MMEEKETDTVEYEIQTCRSPVPYLCVGGIWVLYALLFPMYLWYHYLIVAAVSVGAFFIATHFFPPKKIRVPKPHTLILSGVADVDKIIKEADARLQSVTVSGKTITASDPALGETVTRLISCAYRIMDYVAENAKQMIQLRRFFNYYLPTLDKLLASYVTVEKHGLDGQNVVSSEKEIRDAVVAMETLFRHQLDKLFRDTALDVSTDVDVLEAMLKSDGIRASVGEAEPNETK